MAWVKHLITCHRRAKPENRVAEVLHEADDFAQVSAGEIVAFLHPTGEAGRVGVLEVVVGVVDDDLSAVGQGDLRTTSTWHSLA